MTASWAVAYEASSEGRSIDAAAKVDLARLGDTLGVGVAIHGDTWGSACVVQTWPRERGDALRIVEFRADEYPALAEACEVRTPDED